MSSRIVVTLSVLHRGVFLRGRECDEEQQSGTKEFPLRVDANGGLHHDGPLGARRHGLASVVAGCVVKDSVEIADALRLQVLRQFCVLSNALLPPSGEKYMHSFPTF